MSTYSIHNEKRMKIDFKVLLHAIIFTTLFIVFMCLFGYQSYERLVMEEVVIKEENVDHNDTPAITICAVRFKCKHFKLF